jgi:hypothetical protein
MDGITQVIKLLFVQTIIQHFNLGGHVWIKIPSLEKGKRIAIPLNTRLNRHWNFAIDFKRR